MRGAASVCGLPTAAHRIPDLQLDLLVVDGDHPCPKLNADGQVMDRLEALVGELQKQTRLAHASVPDDDVPAFPGGADAAERLAWAACLRTALARTHLKR